MSEPIPSDAVVPPSPEPPTEVTASADGAADGLATPSSSAVRKKRRRGSRGGRNRRPRSER